MLPILVQFLNEQHRRHATPADIEIAIARALDSAGEFFANLWNEVGDEGRAALLALAQDGTPRAAASLRDRDVVNEQSGFSVPMVELWVRGRKA